MLGSFAGTTTPEKCRPRRCTAPRTRPRRCATALEQELNDGSLGRRQKIHWLDFCERYLADLASCRRPRTVDDYKKVLEALTADYRPERPEEITPHRLREFVRQQTDGRSPATRNKLIRTLRAIFSWAVPEYIKENLAKRVKFAKEPEHDRRILLPGELVKALSVADARGQAVLLLGACCGLRREEIATLRWEDMDEVSGRVRVRNSAWHTTKSGQQRSVLMPPALILPQATTAKTNPPEISKPPTSFHFRCRRSDHRAGSGLGRWSCPPGGRRASGWGRRCNTGVTPSPI